MVHICNLKKGKTMKRYKGLSLKNNDKFYLFLLIIIVIGALVGSHYFFSKDEPKDSPPSLSELIAERLPAYKTDFEDSIVSMKSNSDVAHYLYNWAKNKEISGNILSKDVVMFTIPASSKETESAVTSVIVSEYDINNMTGHINSLASALTIARTIEDNGPVKIIFVPVSDGDKSAITTLSKEIIPDGAQVFFLEDNDKYIFSTATGGYSSYTVSKPIKYTKPIYTKAFKLSISGLASQYYTEVTAAQPNPIKVIGDLLAHFKTSLQLCELASFEGGENSGKNAASASATIVVDEEEQDSFIKDFDSSIEKILDKYGDEYPDLSYTYEEVECPEKVLSEIDFEDLIGFLYTTSNGIYKRDSSGNILAMSNLGKLSLGSSAFNIEIGSFGCSGECLSELSESYNTLANLIGLSFKSNANIPVFDGSVFSEKLLQRLEKASQEYGSSLSADVESTSNLTLCSYLEQINENTFALNIGVTEEESQNLVGAIVTLLDVSPDVSPKEEENQ